MDYIGREGALPMETDDGRHLQERGFERALIEEWDLDLQARRRHTQRAIAAGRKPPRLVHNVFFSMPPRTPPKKVLEAVRRFAQEKFALEHRYAMVLHTDRPHPHVHMVIKAVSEQGVRLNIKKATLREWRRDFAKHLRDLGVLANATERAVRGVSKSWQKDGIYRAGLRGESTFLRQQVESVASELMKGNICVEPGKSKLLNTRREVERGWRSAVATLLREEQGELAARARRFASEMPKPQTDREMIAENLVHHREASVLVR